MDVEVLKQNMGRLGRIQYLYMPEYAALMPYRDEDQQATEDIGNMEEFENVP